MGTQGREGEDNEVDNHGPCCFSAQECITTCHKLLMTKTSQYLDPPPRKPPEDNRAPAHLVISSRTVQHNPSLAPAQLAMHLYNRSPASRLAVEPSPAREKHPPTDHAVHKPAMGNLNSKFLRPLLGRRSDSSNETSKKKEKKKESKKKKKAKGRKPKKTMIDLTPAATGATATTTSTAPRRSRPPGNPSTNDLIAQGIGIRDFGAEAAEREREEKKRREMPYYDERGFAAAAAAAAAAVITESDSEHRAVVAAQGIGVGESEERTERGGMATV